MVQLESLVIVFFFEIQNLGMIVNDYLTAFPFALFAYFIGNILFSFTLHLMDAQLCLPYHI